MHSTMKFLFLLGLPVCLACSSAREEQASQVPALPKAWYTLPENGGVDAGEPNADVAESAQTAFRAHVRALDASESADTAAIHPTPWHLDGMIVDFSVSTGGVFGVLLGGGTATVKTTWNKIKPGSRLTPVLQTKSPVMKIAAATTTQDLEQQLEPVIRAAVSSGTVRDETTLRKNLRLQGDHFITLCHAMDTVKTKATWYVDSLQLQLTFNALGKVMPTIGVGGALTVYLDWQKPESAAQVSQTPTALSRNLNQFVQTIAEEIPLALGEGKDLAAKGWELSQFQVGMAVTGAGDIGIIAIGGSMNAKLIFAKDGTSTPASVAPAVASGPYVNLLSSAPKSDHLAYAAKVGVAFDRTTLADGSGDPSPEGIVYHIPRDKFKSGLQKAIQMGSYFAGLAKREDTANWKLAIFESEFDLSIGGGSALANVTVMGEIVLDFTPIQKG